MKRNKNSHQKLSPQNNFPSGALWLPDYMHRDFLRSEFTMWLTISCAFFISIFSTPAIAQVPAQQPKALLKLGEKLYEEEEYEKALTIFRQAFDRASAGADKTDQANARKRISDCLYAVGEYEAALDSYRQTLQARESLRDEPEIADTWIRIGNSQFALGDLDEALDNYQRSLIISKKISNQILTAEALSNLGLVHYTLSDLKQALDFYYQSLHIYSEANEIGNIIRLLQSVGNANLRLGNYRVALEAFQNARFLLEKAGKIDEAKQSLLAIGLVHFAQKSYPLALEVYQNAFIHFEKIGDKNSMALALHRIGLVKFAQENFSEALKFQEGALSIGSQSENLDTQWRAQLEVGRAQLMLQQPALAQKAWLQSVATVEKMRASLRGNDIDAAIERVAPYLGLVELASQQNQSLEAFNWAERAKAQLLWAILQSSRNRITKSLAPAEIEAESKARKDVLRISSSLDRAKRKKAPEATIKSTQLQLQTARTNLTTLLQKLYLRHPQLKVYRGEAPSIKADEAAGLIANSPQAVLEYVITENQILLFVLTNAPKKSGRTNEADLNTYVLEISPRELTERITKLRQQIDRCENNYSELSRELYDILIKPAQRQLTGKKSLKIVPDGILWELPFAALQSTENHFLIEDASISIVSSASVWRETEKLARAKNISAFSGLLILAPTNIDQETLAKFKLAQISKPEEMTKRLQQIHGASSSIIVEQNNPDSFAKNFQAITVVAPTMINNYRPLYSFTMLSPKNPDNPKTGFLPVWQMMQFKGSANLMAMTEAQSFPPFQRPGHGFIGLSWVAFVMGTPTILINQWPTERHDLTIDFLQNYKAKKNSNQAFQQAALKQIQSNEYRHPMNWAGFLLIGNANQK